MFKTLFPEINKSNDFKKYINKKSDYLKNLEKRKNKSLRILNKTKMQLLKQKLQKLNHIERNYKIFSIKEGNKLPINDSYKFHYTPNIKLIFLSPEEAENSERYKKKDFDIDGFSLIYKTTNSTDYPIRIFNITKFNEKAKFNNSNKKINNTNYQNKNNKSSFDSFLTSIGNSVIFSNSRYNSSVK